MIISVILHWVLTALILMLVTYVVPGLHIDGFGTALLAAFVMGLVNVFLKPILSLLTLPLNIVTLGLFSFIINALLFALVAAVVPGFVVTNFLAALVGSLLMAIMTSLLGMMGAGPSRSAI